MISWDWMGMVMIRSDTCLSRSMTGTMKFRPGCRVPTTRPSRNSTPRSYCLTIRSDSASPTIASRAITMRMVSSTFMAGSFLSFVASVVVLLGGVGWVQVAHGGQQRLPGEVVEVGFGGGLVEQVGELVASVVAGLDGAQPVTGEGERRVVHSGHQVLSGLGVHPMTSLSGGRRWI